MKAEKICRLTGILLCIFFWQGAAGAQSVARTPESVAQTQSNAEFNFIHLGDLIEVEVVGYVDYYWRGTLTPEGFLNGPEEIEERIFALCREEQAVAAEIAKILGKILREPKVVVRILDRSSRPPSTVYGAVRVPQRFQIKRAVYLNELIVLAGGFTDQASGEIEIFRAAGLSCAEMKKNETGATADNDRETKSERFVSASQDTGSKMFNIKIADLLSGKKEANLQILGGDVVTVLEAQPIYVIGGVNSPRQIATRSQITVSRAVSSAGGLTKDADPTRVTIFRRVASETKIIEVDLEKIKTNASEDIVLQPFDIVEVLQKGREKRKFPPAIKVEDAADPNPSKLPLRIID